MIVTMQKRMFIFFICVLALFLSASATAQTTGLPEGVVDSQFIYDTPLTPEESLELMTVPDGFHITLYANEPHVQQPIAMTFDDRGRLWVAECYSYPLWQRPEDHDRVLIFEDTDHDGQFDKRKVFIDNGHNLTGIQIGFGGVWLCSTPNLIFIPDVNRDDQPDGPPQVVLDGWNDTEVAHNVFNNLTWGPDGWLWGTHGILDESLVGSPGTPEDERVRINCGVWRYHPLKKTFEAVAHGTTNPWGLDFDDHGHAFMTNNVVGHLWHVIPGAHYERMYGDDYNKHVYGLMEMTADHLHWGGGHWTTSRGGTGVHSEAGGGHSHCGGMIYLGDNWPDEYRESIYMCNIHGKRINRDVLERTETGFVGRHAKDFMLANNEWFIGSSLKYGPRGTVYVSDWHDFGECHGNDGIHRSSGRIFNIYYNEVPKLEPFDLKQKSNIELVELQLHKNDWYVRHARRILQERAADGTDMQDAHRALMQMLKENDAIPRKLRALWALHVTGGLDAAFLTQQLNHENEDMRIWALRLLCDEYQPDAKAIDALTELATKEKSAMVRLYLASSLQKLPIEQRTGIASALLSREQDHDSRNYSLMLWYGIEPLVAQKPDVAIELARNSPLSLIRRNIARRRTLARAADEALTIPPELVQLLKEENNNTLLADTLAGIKTAMEGERSAQPPDEWSTVYTRLVDSSDESIKMGALELALMFGDRRSTREFRKLLIDFSASSKLRLLALNGLLQVRDSELAPLLHLLVQNDKTLRSEALSALALYDHERTSDIILQHYSSFSDENKEEAIQTLASRPSTALDLLQAVQTGRIPQGDISAYSVRQLQKIGDEEITQTLENIWGRIRPASEEKQRLMERYNAVLTSEFMAIASLPNGRKLYNDRCASCHKLFGEGREVGPEITGSDRTNIDYLLENILDPNALLPEQYKMIVIETTDGRILGGIVEEQNERSITLITQADRIIVRRDEIKEMRDTGASMMPEGLLQGLSDDDVRDLFAYLSSPGPGSASN